MEAGCGDIKDQRVAQEGDYLYLSRPLHTNSDKPACTDLELTQIDVSSTDLSQIWRIHSTCTVATITVFHYTERCGRACFNYVSDQTKQPPNIRPELSAPCLQKSKSHLINKESVEQHVKRVELITAAPEVLFWQLAAALEEGLRDSRTQTNSSHTLLLMSPMLRTD
ncbi:hypothetical protein PAMP_006467 [Pampus punctatissimus]